MQSTGQWLGRYQLRSRLGSGGMAEVYLASQKVSGSEKLVVIKQILPEHCRDERVRDMMLDEARIGLRLRHQNIVQTLDAGLEDIAPFVALEYIDGVDLGGLEDYYDELGQPLQPQLVAYIGGELLAGLDYAHRAVGESGAPLHIVHRDVTPHNVLISTEGEIKLTDFGIAMAKDRVSRTSTGGLKGKLRYMAPEQLDAGQVDHRTDLYGAAATLYEALCGVPPYSHESEFESLRRLEKGELTPIADHRGDVPPMLAALIERALHPDPNIRPQTAREMLHDIEEFVGSRRRMVEQLAEAVQTASQGEKKRKAANKRLERLLVGDPDDDDDDAPEDTFAEPTREMGSDVSVELAPEPIDSDEYTDVPARRRTGLWIAVGILAVALLVGGAFAIGRMGGAGDERRASAPEAAVPPGNTTESAAAATPTDAAATPTDAAATPTDAAATPSETGTAGADESGTAGADESGDKRPGVSARRKDADQRRKARDQRRKDRDRRRKDRDQPKAGRGKLSVNTVPWSKVFVDGKYVGDTPVRGHSLSAGKHKLRVHNPKTGQTRRKTIEIKAGKTLPVRLTL